MQFFACDVNILFMLAVISAASGRDKVLSAANIWAAREIFVQLSVVNFKRQWMKF